jgi:glycerol-3-phosphate dehydrogenase
MAQQEVTCAVLVCGGGFAGAKLAVELAVKGVDVLLVSR